MSPELGVAKSGWESVHQGVYPFCQNAGKDQILHLPEGAILGDHKDSTSKSNPVSRRSAVSFFDRVEFFYRGQKVGQSQ